MANITINIIMLNLLIAMIVESFKKINSHSELTMYQEKADLISENSYLIPTCSRVSHCQKNKYLFVAREVGTLKKDDDDLGSKLDDVVTGVESIVRIFFE